MRQASGAFLLMDGSLMAVQDWFAWPVRRQARRQKKIFSSDCIVPLDKTKAVLISCVMEKRRKGAYKMAVTNISPLHAQRISACL